MDNVFGNFVQSSKTSVQRNFTDKEKTNYILTALFIRISFR